MTNTLRRLTNLIRLCLKICPANKKKNILLSLFRLLSDSVHFVISQILANVTISIAGTYALTNPDRNIPRLAQSEYNILNPYRLNIPSPNAIIESITSQLRNFTISLVLEKYRIKRKKEKK
jgi:hypothetical protein